MSSKREASNSLPISDSGLIASPDASGARSPRSSVPAGGGGDAAEESGELGATDIKEDPMSVLVDWGSVCRSEELVVNELRRKPMG